MKLEKTDFRITVMMAASMAVIICILLGIFIYAKHDFGIKLDPLPKPKMEDDLTGYSITRVRLIMATGGRTGLMVYMAIPYKKMEQRVQIYKNLVRIENDLVMKIEPQMIYQLAGKKDYATLKMIFMNIINTYLDKPIDRIYFQEFFIMG